jgi:heme/copper-type cytochrome/quinol oxidase subunit 2
MSQRTARPIEGLTRIVQILLVVQAVVAAAAAAVTWSTGLPAPEEDGLFALIMIAQFLLYLAGGIVYLVWVHRASANAEAFGAEGMSAGPGMAVAWYFIPVANLFMPLVVMRETWKASANPPNWEVERAPATLILWWILWIVGNIAGIAAARLGADDETGSLEAAYWLSIASDILTIPGALLLVGITGGLAALQTGRIAASPA